MNEDMNIEDVMLPELSEARIDEIEDALFAEIARERSAEARGHAEADRARRVRRGRIWLGAGAAAAVIVVAAVMAPTLPSLLGGVAGSASTADQGAPEIAPGFGADLSGGASSSSSGEDEAGPLGDREIIATAAATVRVDDAAAAAERIGDEAQALGGYVEAMSVGGAESTREVYDSEGGVSFPVSSGAWITIRVPADTLSDAMTALGDIGEVTASQVDRRDVTSEAVDLRARVEALEASVERLTSLVSQAESTSDLIAAEDALAARQADLESYQQQLKRLDEQVGLSTLTVSLFEPAPAVQADPAGFGDGVTAGWNGLLVTLNGFVVALGFLLPWLAVLAVIGLIAWGARRAVKRRRTRTAAGAEDLP